MKLDKENGTDEGQEREEPFFFPKLWEEIKERRKSKKEENVSDDVSVDNKDATPRWQDVETSSPKTSKSSEIGVSMVARGEWHQ